MSDRQATVFVCLAFILMLGMMLFEAVAYIARGIAWMRLAFA